MANYLALSSIERKIFGIELYSQRVKEAKKGLKNVKVIQGNILKNNFPKANTILLIHVLHHLSSYDQQLDLIKQCKDKLNKNGNLIIVEIDQHPILKYILTCIVDVIVFPIIFEKKLYNFNIFYRSKKDWKTCLKNSGFSVKTIEAHQTKPFSHFIFFCKKL